MARKINKEAVKNIESFGFAQVMTAFFSGKTHAIIPEIDKEQTYGEQIETKGQLQRPVKYFGNGFQGHD